MFVRFGIFILLFFAGELPKELGNLVNLTELRLDDNQFRGKLYVPSYMRLCVSLTFHFFCAGEVPKELGYLVNLTKLYLDNNQFRGELHVPYYIRIKNITSSVCDCTVTEDEKSALKAKLPKMQQICI